MRIVLFAGNPLTGEYARKEMDAEVASQPGFKCGYGEEVEDVLDAMMDALGYSDCIWFVYPGTKSLSDMEADFTSRMVRSKTKMVSGKLPQGCVRGVVKA